LTHEVPHVIAPHTLLGAAGIGLLIGFLGGLLGKGGSAIATPLLHAIGVPAIIAVAAPLPATIPSTLAASWVYWKQRYMDQRVVRACVAWGVPATVAGAIATKWIGGAVLVRLTDALLLVLGARLLLHRPTTQDTADPDGPTALDDGSTHAESVRAPLALAATHAVSVRAPLAAAATSTSTSTTTLALRVRGTPAPHTPARSGAARQADGAATLALVAILVGFSAGLLANSGGFLLAPLMITVVKMPIRPALATSLAVSAVLAIPGTIVHAALGHIDWTLVAVLAVTSVPLSIVGARLALRVEAVWLERIYGAALVLLGGFFLFAR
jgi:uncharacterized membrane protein YfcA